MSTDAATAAIRRQRTGAGLGVALLLGLALLLLSYLRIAVFVRTSAFNSTKVIAQTLTEPLWQTQLGRNILLFVLALLLLHLAFAAACWLLALLSERAWPKARATRRQWVLVWFVGATLWVLVANASYFPRASLGAPYQKVAQLGFGGITLHGLVTAGILTALTLTLLSAGWRVLGPRRLGWSVVGAAVLVAATGLMLHAGATPAAGAGPPNVILLGIDSLRPDMTTTARTPHMQAFLDRSLRLNDAVTPLARTFPSWMSILTGRHPHSTGAVMNLLPRELIHAGQTLPELLRARGYHTVFAIDETRFANIDTTYGFDRTITPPIGGSDFVLTWFSDTPLSNVVMNTRLGALLFPFQHANRAAFVTYQPDSFVRQVDRALDTRQPLFLALHLTLPHWPLEWSDSTLPSRDEAPTYEAAMQWKYLNALHRADQQFGDLLAVLERKGLLANTIVVALSDHGEAFGAEDGFRAEAFAGVDVAEDEVASYEIGHGTSVFSPPQYHTVLGFRAYGAAAALLPAPRQFTEPVSMLDVAPTLLDLLQLPATEPMDGQSLLPLFRAEPAAAAGFSGRIRFTESEYNPNGFRVDKITASAIAAAAMVYEVDPRTDRLKVRTKAIDMILNSRQYAALQGDSLAAGVPTQIAGLYRFVYLPGSGPIDPRQQQRMRQALQDRFKLQFVAAGATAP